MDKFERAMRDDWMAELNPETRYGETLYLLGWTDVARRREVVAGVHANLLSAAVDHGWFGVDQNSN